MFYFGFTAETLYCGTEATDYRIFKERPTDAELDEMAADFGQNNAESYEYLVTGWLEDEDEFEPEDSDIIESAAAIISAKSLAGVFESSLPAEEI